MLIVAVALTCFISGFFLCNILENGYYDVPQWPFFVVSALAVFSWGWVIHGWFLG
jgi:hypothetical protein